MIIIGLIIAITLGWFVIKTIGVKVSKVELLGLATLIGLAAQTMLMLILDAISIPLNALSASCAAVVAMGVIWYFLRRKGAALGIDFTKFSIKSLSFKKGLLSFKNIKIDYRNLNIVWLVAILLVCYIELMNGAKTLYFPPFDRDSLAGFETIGYVVAQEGTFHNLSLFDSSYIPSISAAGSYISYSPMVQLSYGWAYMWGCDTSKIIPFIIYLAFLFSLYGAIRRVSNDMSAALVLLFVMLAPEMTAFASLSATNVMHAAYASIGVIYSVQWFKNRDFSILVLGSVMLAANVWVRQEGVVFIAAVGLLMLTDAIKHKQWMPLWYMAGICLTPMVVWGSYSAIFGLNSESIIITAPFWDGIKAEVIWEFIKTLHLTPQFYGWGFAAFAVSAVASVYYMVRYGRGWRMVVVVAAAMVLYCVMLYQIDYKWDTITNVLAYSAKRFMFCFVPLWWYYAVTCPPISALLGKLNTILRG